MLEKKKSVLEILKGVGFFEELSIAFKVIGVILGSIVIVALYGLCFYAFDFKDSDMSNGLVLGFLVYMLAILLVFLVAILTSLFTHYDVPEFIDVCVSVNKTIKAIVGITWLSIGYFIGNYVIDSTGFRVHNVFLNMFMGITIVYFVVMFSICIISLCIGLLLGIFYPIRQLRLNVSVVNALTYMPIEVDEIKKLKISNYIDYERYILNLFHIKKTNLTVTHKLQHIVENSLKKSLMNWLTIYGFEDNLLFSLYQYPVSKELFADLRAIKLRDVIQRYTTIQDLEQNIKDCVKSVEDHYELSKRKEAQQKQEQALKDAVKKIEKKCEEIEK